MTTEERSANNLRMAIEAGDRYLTMLSAFVEENTAQLVEGAVVLKLNPVGLHYVQSRLEGLEELETLRIRAPVDYLRAYVADLGDHRALERLRRVLRLLSSLKVVATTFAQPSRNPMTITLRPFSRLRSLELRNCDLSTTAPRGLLELRPILESLICYNSAEALRHIFAERTKEIKGAPVWSRLSNISCFGNEMAFMDESLQLLPAVEALDLGRNRFAMVTNLEKCPNLKFLDVGFNRITTVASLNQILRGIVKLVLRNNALDSTRGLHNLPALEALDLSYNLISSVKEVEVLGDLPSLRLLWLHGNPVTFRRLYRNETLSYFQAPSEFVLDGKKTSRLEDCAARRLATWRVKRVSKYGAFIPAETQTSSDSSVQFSDFEQDSTLPFSSGEAASTSATQGKPKRRSSRLASILDFSEISNAIRSVDSILPLPPSTVVSLDTSQAEPQQVESKDDTEEIIHNLMERAEALKRTGSSSWLKDLNALLDSDGLAKVKDREKVERIDKEIHQTESLQKKKTKKKDKLSRKSTAEGFGPIVLDSRAAIDNEGETSHGSFSQNNSAMFSRENSARLSRENSKLSRDSAVGLSEGRSADLSQQSSAKLKALRRETNSEEGESLFGHLTSTGALDDPSLNPAKPVASYVNAGDQLKLPTQSGAFRLSEEFVAGSMSHTSSTAVPPQFHQDLLHRRHTLERERLQLPPEVDVLSADVSDSSSESMSSDLIYSSDDDADKDTSSGWSLYTFDQDDGDNLASEKQLERYKGNSTGKEIFQAVNPPDRNLQISDTTDGRSVNDGEDSKAFLLSARAAGVIDGDTNLEGTNDKSTNACSGIANAHSDAVQGHSEEDVKVTFPKLATDPSLRQLAIPTTSGHHKNDLGAVRSRADPGIEEPSSTLRQEKSDSTTCNSPFQPKPKSSRRIVYLDSPSGAYASSTPLRSSSDLTHSSDPRNMRRHSTSSFAMGGTAGQVLPRSLSSVQYSQPLGIRLSATINQDSESQRDWPRSRGQEESFPSTSLQTVESH